MKPAAGFPAQVAEFSSVGRLSSLHTSPLPVPNPVFGMKEWSQYFGEVEAEPCLPSDINEILNGPCPFWSGKQVRDTHLLALIPATVDGKPFSLNLLGELIQHPKDESYPTKYRNYGDAIEKRFGNQSPVSSYWVLMTRDVLEGSREKDYASQKALVAAHAKRTSIPYEIPGALEAATAILSHYVRIGERFYPGIPCTHTRCQELVAWGGSNYPVVVGGFSSGGFDVHDCYADVYDCGIAGLRRFNEKDTGPKDQIPTQVAELSSVGRLSSLHTSPLPVPNPVFGMKEWSQYFGEVGAAPCLPPDIDEILGSPCPFWSGKQVKDTHLLALIPATVDGKPFSLNLLGELIQHSKGGGYSTKYRVYDGDIQELIGAQSPISSYWVLMTRDVLEGSKSRDYASQRALVARHARRTGLPYEIPGVLEAATVILSHYVCRGERLYTNNPCTYTRCQELITCSNRPVCVGEFSFEGVRVSGDVRNVHLFYGVASLRKFEEIDMKPAAGLPTQVAELSSAGRLSSLHTSPLPVPNPVFGMKEWSQYFGEVEAEPCLPSDINEILNGPCPFWSGKQVRDTHLLALIPATVDGKPFSLNLLGELIQHSKGGGYSTKYRVYDGDIQERLGAQSPVSSYWVLMTRDVLEGSRNETYACQQALVAHHASRTGLPYELPGALEAATAILAHYVHRGERLYADAPWTSTRCQELVVDDEDMYPIVVGGFSSVGFCVSVDDFDCIYVSGVAGLRKFEEIDMKPTAGLPAQVAEFSSVGHLSSLHTSPLPVPNPVFGMKEWSQYFGEVGAAPCLPPDIDEILGSPCPFWSGKQVKDTHLLVLIPSKVDGKSFSLGLLEELVMRSQGRGYSTEHGIYGSYARGVLGTRSPVSSYWVLMTRDVLEGSRDKDYASQRALVARHTRRAGLPYELPGFLEAATVILSHYVRSGERLYTDDPWTYTRCQELVAWGSNNCPAVVGGFSPGGLGVHDSDFASSSYGVAGLRKF